MPVIQVPEPARDLATAIERLPGLLAASKLVPLIGISKTTIYDLVTEQQIPYIRIGTIIRFDPIAIAAWLRQHAVAA